MRGKILPSFFPTKGEYLSSRCSSVRHRPGATWSPPVAGGTKVGSLAERTGELQEKADATCAYFCC